MSNARALRELFWADGHPRSWTWKLAALLVTVSAAVLVAVHFVYTPLYVDGAWYGYPSYALAEGRDAGENFAMLSDLEGAEGVTVSFNFDTRHLRTWPLAGWFSVFGVTIWAAKSYAMLEFTLLAAALGWVVSRSVTTRWIGGLIWLLGMSDIALLTLGSADLRPDLFVAALGLCVAALTIFEKSISWAQVAVAMMLSLALVLTHLTAGVAFAVLGGTMVADLYVNKDARTQTRLAAYMGVIAVGFAGLLFARTLREVLVPSDVETPFSLYYPNLLPNLDFARIAAKEIGRWQQYFLDSNISILAAFVVAGIVALCAPVTLRGPSTSGRRLLLPMACGMACAIVTLALINPHGAGSHGVSAIVFGFVLIGLLIEHTLPIPRAWAGLTLYGILGLASVAKVALSGKIYLESTAAQFSNAAVWDAVNAEVSDPAVDIVIGPAKLWAYLDSDHDILVLDVRAEDIDAFAGYARRADRIFIDEEYMGFDFVERFEQAFPSLTTEIRMVVGDTEAADYLQILAVVDR